MLLRDEGFQRLCRARDLLRECTEPAPSIETLARALNISPFHFIRQFEAVFGVTPHQYRMKARLDAAKDLLAQGDHSVTGVAFTQRPTPAGPVTLAVCADTCGNLIQLYQPTGAA
jgi:AraC-like DNA-binding protein